MLPELLPCRRGLPTQATKSRLMKFLPVLLTALPDQSTPSIQKATYSLKDTGAGKVLVPFTPPCSLLEQCWEAGERGTPGLSLRSVLTFIPAVQRPHLRSAQALDSSHGHSATWGCGGWALSRSSPRPAWAHADHPRLPHGQCWPGSPVRASDQSRPQPRTGLEWSSQSSPARGSALTPTCPIPELSVWSPQPGPGQASGEQPRVCTWTRQGDPSQKRETRRLKPAP